MRRPRTKLEALSIGQLAHRWGVGPDRVRGLVESGKLPGAFRIPSVGRFGAAIKVPLATVLQVEQDWAVVPRDASSRRHRETRQRANSMAMLQHLPELMASPERGGECREADPCQGEHNDE
jgi:hypothetical protein